MAIDGIPGKQIFRQRDVRRTPTTAFTAAEAVPIGAILPWLKSFTGTGTLPTGYVECDGSVLNDADSVYNGATLPDLNGNEFIRGAATSGGIGGGTTGGGSSHSHTLSAGHAKIGADGNSGSDRLKWRSKSVTSFTANTEIITITGLDSNASTFGTELGGSSNNENSHTHASKPKFYDVVWIMRVK